ncbi:hypothetical protein FKM82_010231 [Ascaphus truei]
MALAYVDCHCHMTAEEFMQDTEDIIEKSRQEGIQALISVTEHEREFESLIHLSDRYPDFIMPCFGVHPIQSNADGQYSVTVKISRFVVVDQIWTQDIWCEVDIFESKRNEGVTKGDEQGSDFVM